MDTLQAGVKSAESSRRKPAKVLDHIEVHPRTAVGPTVVRHVYKGYEHDPKEHTYPESKDREAAKHILKHSGLGHVLEGESGEAVGEGEGA